jgi:MFS family permease
VKAIRATLLISQCALLALLIRFNLVFEDTQLAVVLGAVYVALNAAALIVLQLRGALKGWLMAVSGLLYAAFLAFGGGYLGLPLLAVLILAIVRQSGGWLVVILALLLVAALFAFGSLTVVDTLFPEAVLAREYNPDRSKSVVLISWDAGAATTERQAYLSNVPVIPGVLSERKWIADRDRSLPRAIRWNDSDTVWLDNARYHVEGLW